MYLTIGLMAAAGAAGFFFGPVGPAAVLGLAGLVIGARLLAQQSWSAPATRTASDPAPPPTSAEPSSLFEGMGLWILVAVVTRLLLVVLLNATSMWRSFAPDALGWEAYGQQLLDYWTGALAYPEPWMEGLSGRTLYASLNAASLWLFGTARYPLSLLNALAGIGAAAVMGRLAKEIWGVAVGRRTFLLCMFFPSMMVWTCMSIRESYAYLSIGLLLLGIQQLRSRVALSPIVLVAISLPLLLSIRSYLVPLIVVAAGMSLVVVRVRQLPYALVALSFLALLVGYFGQELGITTELVSEEKLEEVHRLRNGLAFGGSAYGTEADTRTWSGIITYLPEGIIRFLFAPFPWAIRSWRQAMTLPESVIWMVLFGQAILGIVHEARRNLASIATPLFVTILVTLAYALVSGNEGTAYRHRAQIMIILFMFSAVYQVRRATATAPSAVPTAPSGLVPT